MFTVECSHLTESSGNYTELQFTAKDSFSQ